MSVSSNMRFNENEIDVVISTYAIVESIINIRFFIIKEIMLIMLTHESIASIINIMLFDCVLHNYFFISIFCYVFDFLFHLNWNDFLSLISEFSSRHKQHIVILVVDN